MAGATWFDLVTIDAVDCAAACVFWGQLLGLEVQQNQDDHRWMVIGHEDGTRVLGFQRSTPAELRMRRSGRLHLDVQTEIGSLDATVERAIRLGAIVTRDRTSYPYGDLVTLHDPDGGVFCIYGYPSGVKGQPKGPGPFFDLVTVDVADPRRSAEFWCQATKVRVLEDQDEGRAVILGLETGERFIGLQRSTASDLVASTSSRVHIDLECEPDDFENEVGRLIELGAVRIGAKRTEHFGLGQVLVDLDGTIFCQNAYTPSPADGRHLKAVARGRVG